MNPRRKILLSLVALLLGLAGTGCLNFHPVTNPIRYFVLAPTEVAEAAARETVVPSRVRVTRVELPDYLSRPWMVVRLSDMEIRYADFDKWAEPLDSAIQWVLTRNLEALLGSDLVSPDQKVDPVSVELVILRFDVEAGGRVTLETRWRMTGAPRSTGQEMIHREGPEPGSDPAGAARTMSEALGELSRILAAEIQR